MRYPNPFWNALPGLQNLCILLSFLLTFTLFYVKTKRPYRPDAVDVVDAIACTEGTWPDDAAV